MEAAVDKKRMQKIFDILVWFEGITTPITINELSLRSGTRTLQYIIRRSTSLNLIEEIGDEYDKYNESFINGGILWDGLLNGFVNLIFTNPSKDEWELIEQISKIDYECDLLNKNHDFSLEEAYMHLLTNIAMDFGLNLEKEDVQIHYTPEYIDKNTFGSRLKNLKVGTKVYWSSLSMKEIFLSDAKNINISLQKDHGVVV